MKNGYEPAFPVECVYDENGLHGQQTGNRSGFELGLTKREYFAAMAMQGIIGNSAMIDTSDDNALAWVASVAKRTADALLAELENPENT